MSTAQQQWAKAIDLCRVGMVADGYQPSTIARVLKEVAAFSRSLTIGPWDVDGRLIETWTERDELSAQRGYVLRTSLRTFYRWAYRTGRVPTDPTEYVSKRQRPAVPPSEWLPAVESYRRYMRSSQAAKLSIQLRVYQLTRIANELPVRGPWEVEAEDLVDWMAGHNWARETTRQWRSTLRSFYAWGQLMGHIERNPALAIPRVSARPPMPRPATEDAYFAALSSAGARETLMLRLAAELGLRRGEVALVHSDDLNPQPDGWWLDVHGKGSRTRRLPVPDDLAGALRRLPAGWAFPGSGDGHLSAQHVGILVTRLLPHGVTMHALRHRFATRAYAVDRDLFLVQMALGHASPTTTRAYVDLPTTDLRRLMDAV
jgi:integrase